MRNLECQEIRDLRYKLAQKHLEFRKLLSDPKIDEKTLLEKQKELIALGGELQSREAQTLIKIRKILSPEQIGAMDSMPPPPSRHRKGGKGRGPMGAPCFRGDQGPDDGGDRYFGPRPK